MTTKISGRTPDEIKKGLECCIGDCTSYHCHECPYRKNVENACDDSGMQLCGDALALIQQLECRLRDTVNDLTDYGKACETCLFQDLGVLDEPCASCKSVPESYGSNWQWRGTKKVNENDSEKV